MSLIDNGERFPLVSLFGERKQFVVYGYSQPQRNPDKIDLLQQFTPGLTSQSPVSEKVVITAIAGKFHVRLPRKTYTTSELTPEYRSLSTQSVRILAGEVAKLPSTYPPPFFGTDSSASPLLIPESTTVMPGPSIYPRNVNNVQYTLWKDEVVKFDLNFDPAFNNVSTSRSLQPQSFQTSFQHTHLQIPVEFGTYTSEWFPFPITFCKAEHHPFFMFFSDTNNYSFETNQIRIEYEFSIVYHEASETPYTPPE